MSELDIGDDIDEREFQQARDEYVDGEISIEEFEARLEGGSSEPSDHGDAAEEALRQQIADGEIGPEEAKEAIEKIRSQRNSSDDGDGDWFDRFDNADVARERSEEKEAAREERKQELAELHGAAQDIFLQRIYDEFTITKHGTELSFYRPVDLTRVQFTDLDDYDRDVVERLKEGSRLIVEHKRRELEVVRSQQEDNEVSIEEMVDRAFENADLQRRILAAFAVDESMQDPDVWAALFPDESKLRDIFQDFFTEGEGQQMMKTLQMLQSRQSGS